MKCPRCGTEDTSYTGECVVCGRNLSGLRDDRPQSPRKPSRRRVLEYFLFLGVGEPILLAAASFLSNIQGVTFQLGLFEVGFGVLFFGAFGSLYGGTSAMLPREKWFPYFQNSAQGAYQEDMMSKLPLALFLLILGSITLAISLVL